MRGGGDSPRTLFGEGGTGVRRPHIRVELGQRKTGEPEQKLNGKRKSPELKQGEQKKTAWKTWIYLLLAAVDRG